MARLDITNGLVTVTLSRRNLLALTHLLDVGHRYRVIANGDCYRHGQPVRDIILILRPEEDEPHYARRAEAAGQMRPDAEPYIAKSQQPPTE